MSLSTAPIPHRNLGWGNPYWPLLFMPKILSIRFSNILNISWCFWTSAHPKSLTDHKTDTSIYQEDNSNSHQYFLQVHWTNTYIRTASSSAPSFTKTDNSFNSNVNSNLPKTTMPKITTVKTTMLKHLEKSNSKHLDNKKEFKIKKLLKPFQKIFNIAFYSQSNKLSTFIHKLV